MICRGTAPIGDFEPIVSVWKDRDNALIPIRVNKMDILTAVQLTKKKCVPCEGGVPKLTREEAEAFLKNVAGWTLSPDGIRIRREWRMKNFVSGIEFFETVTEIAESEGHHPDLHLVGYRDLSIEIWTHAIGGLSENDFILAAKINELPVKLAKA